MPFPELTKFLSQPYSTRFYDRNGRLLQVKALEDGLRREWYDLESLPPTIPQVFIAAEDERFYRHGGIDFFAMIRAAMQNISQGRRVSGGSTISMQVARIIIPRDKGKKVTLWTKIVEAWNALRIEAKLSKDEILELYLNNLPFGMQAEGIGSAARTYYGLTPQQLSFSQIHALAVVPRRPATYNPLQDPTAS
ncbi:MAG: transglycosylase domain-containing protein, partial [Treponema sp.]|nr:transglycosylase domain-containing protein [Treponema sp.]